MEMDMRKHETPGMGYYTVVYVQMKRTHWSTWQIHWLKTGISRWKVV